jgi:hypothetical protein
MQETIMRNLVQCTEYEVYMHAKFEYLDIYIFLQLNTSMVEL